MSVICSSLGSSDVLQHEARGRGCNWLDGPVVTFCVRDSEASGSERDEEDIDKCRGY
jgi:hypothetical protein